MYGASDVPADFSDTESFRNLAASLPEGAVWVTSHLARAKGTARAIADAGHPTPEPIVEPGFGEQSFGAWQGRSYAELEAGRWAPEYHKFWVAPASYAPPGGESFLAVSERVRAGIERLTEAHRGRDIVVVAHGGTIRAALAYALDLDPDRALGFATENLSLTRIDHMDGPGLGGDWRVAFVNVRAK